MKFLQQTRIMTEQKINQVDNVMPVVEVSASNVKQWNTAIKILKWLGIAALIIVGIIWINL